MPIVNAARVSPQSIAAAAREAGTPLYLYDEDMIAERCREVLAMPNAFGLTVRYAMKANPAKAILQIVTAAGLGLDSSSLNEARRAAMAGVPCDRMMLTTQEVPEGDDRRDREAMMSRGLVYTACSQRQLELAATFARSHRIKLAVRVNPGIGAGESVTRNTGDKYSSFGFYLAGLPQALGLARDNDLVISQVHVHIGSGGDPVLWQGNIDRMLDIVDKYFPDAETLDLGGGFKEARMPDEKAADIAALGAYAKRRFEELAARSGRRLRMAVEPGTYIMANAGYLVTRVLDKKSSGPDGFEFIVVDGGMEANARPLMYGSRHPFYVVSKKGELMSSDWNLHCSAAELADRVVVGRCCESGDSQSLDDRGHIVPRTMADPDVGDYVVIGGTGAYCSAMTPFNYNSYLQAPEVLLRSSGELTIIRERQRLEQVVTNERGIER